MEEENVAMDPAADGQSTVGPSSKVVTHSGGGDHGGFSLDNKNKMLKESLVWQSVGNVSGRAVTFKGISHCFSADQKWQQKWGCCYFCYLS
jgi:hypothetical protein